MSTPAAELERELRRLAFVEHRRLLGSLSPAARAVLAMRLNPVTEVHVHTGGGARGQTSRTSTPAASKPATT